MQKRTVRFAKVATLAVIPLAVVWATSTPPVGRSGAPGDTTCAACHGGAGTGSVAITSTSGMANYTPGASKHFTVTVSGSGGRAGFEVSARPAGNLSGGLAGNFVAGTGTQVVCKVGTTCAAGNPQYIRSTSATTTPAVYNFDWAAPAGTEDVTLYVAAAVGYSGNTYVGSYVLKAGGVTPPPTLTVAPGSLSFAYQVGGTAPAAQTLAISGAATTYTASASGGTWLSVTPASGGTSGSASVSVNTAGLAAGSYTGSVIVTASGSTGSPKTVPVTLTVTPAAPTLTVSPAALSFAYQIGSAAPAAKALSINGAATTYTAAVSGGAWLSVSPASGGTSGTANVAVNTAGLAAGSYTGSVTVTAGGSTGSPKTVPVTLTVTAAPPTLTVSPAALTFAYQTGSAVPGTQSLAISGAATTYTAVASGGTWLSVSPASGGTSGAASVSVNTTGLAAGTYNGSVTITAAGSTGSPKTVPVTLNVTVAPPTLTVNPSSLAFSYQIGGAAPAAQTVNISGVVSTFTAAASGGAWLSVSVAQSSVSVSVNTAALAAGNYTGSVIITSAGSTGSPKTVPVTLTVTAAQPTLTVSPASLAFTYKIGGTAPAAQTITIGGVASPYAAAASGGSWLSVSPASGPSGSAAVSVNPAGLAAGSYSGLVIVTAAGSTGSPKTVQVSFTVTAASPPLTVSPSSLAFTYKTGSAAPPPQTVAVGGATLNYTAAVSGGSWLSVSPVSGTAPGTVSVSVNPAGLVVGAYTATVTVTAPGAANGAQVVAVSLTVTDPSPLLQVTPATLSFTCATGNQSPLPYVLNVATSGTALNYTATIIGSSWLSVGPTKGATPGALFVSVNPTGLSAGTYKASVRITPVNSPGTAQTVPVTMTLNGGTPSTCPVTPER